MDQTGEVLETLGSAYAGQAGIDTFEILSQLDDDDDDGSIDSVGKMLGMDTDDSLTCEEIAAKRLLLGDAIKALKWSVGGNESLLDNDGKTKLAIYGFTDLTLILGQIVCRV